MSDVREELERLRRDVDQLLARLPALEAQDETAHPYGGKLNEAVVRTLKESLRREGKTRGIAICRVVVMMNEGGTGIRSGIMISSSAADFETPPRMRASVVALATDPLALGAVRRLIQPFFDGKPKRMTKAELAAVLDVSEVEVENSLRPLVADKMLTWSKTAAGEESYEVQDEEPHLLLILSVLLEDWGAARLPTP